MVCPHDFYVKLSYAIGAYLLSCASEDALLISQISSGQKQFIPRLGSEIVGLSLSPSGSKYALSMGNNTIKILDAANSQLISEISGILLPPLQVLTSTRKPRLRSIALLQPVSDRLYVTGIEGSSGIVQGYDLLHDQQALRFDVAAHSRIRTSGVDKRPVYQAEINLACFSHDGRWFATLDEWHDRGSLEDPGVAETTLKFWYLRGREWVMTTKVESPHGLLCHVLDLASPSYNQADLEFATLGADSKIKIWRSFGEPRGGSSPTWGLFRTIGSDFTSDHSDGSILYSPDGTILLASVGSCIFVIGQPNGNVLKRINVGQLISNIDIVDRYVVSLHSRPPVLSCSDIATGRLLFTERLDSATSTLAANSRLSTFAIATSSAQGNSVITVSRISRGRRIDETRIHLNSRVVVLLGANLSFMSGFVYVDEFGQIGSIASRLSNGNVVRRMDISGRTATDPSSIVSSLTASEERGTPSRQANGRSVNGIVGVLEQDGDIDLGKTFKEIIQCI